MSKVISIFKRSVETTEDLARGSWPEFLRTAAWNYRYNFPNQVLIYAQRPQATACASMKDWNQKLHRRVNAGATGIALLEDSGNSMRLSYIFDVEDTHSPTGTPAPIWTMTQEKEEAVRIVLADTFLPASHPYRDDVMAPAPSNFYYEIAVSACEQLASQSVQDLLSMKESCESLRPLDNNHLEWEFRTLLQTSVASVMMYRCGLEPDVDPDVWKSAERFEDIQAMAILGQATQSIARQSLDIARQAVRKWDREHKEEKAYEQQTDISAGRTVQNSGIDHPAAAAAESVREDAKAVSAGTQTESVYAADADRGADGAPAQHRGADADAGVSADGSPDGAEPGAGEGEGQSELDSLHEQDADTGRADGLSGDDLRLTDEEGEPLPDASSEGLEVEFPTVDEQNSAISAAASNLTQDEIHSILDQILEKHGADDKLISVFLDEPNSAEASSALREAFEPLDDVYRIGFSDRIAAVSGHPNGIEIRSGESMIVSWNEFASYFQEQVHNGRFQKDSEALETQPASSDQLREGQIISLSGTQYRVTAISANVVGVQDVNYPLFTNTIPRGTLDILLKNNVPAAVQAPQNEPAVNTIAADQSVTEAPEQHVAEAPENLAETIASVGPFYQEYLEVKKEYPDYIVLNRLNNGYFTFEDDAMEVAKLLGLETVSRNVLFQKKPVSVCFLPMETFPEYSDRLVESGAGLTLADFVPGEGFKTFVIRSEADAIKFREQSLENHDAIVTSPVPEADHSEQLHFVELDEQVETSDRSPAVAADSPAPAPAEPEVPATSVQEHYIPQLLRYDVNPEHTWLTLTAYFDYHTNPADRIGYLREHYGNVYTSVFAANEDEKYISFHGTEDALEIWEDNYLSTNIRDFLPWEDVCRRVEAEIANDRAAAPVQEEPVPVQSSPAVEPEKRTNFRIQDMDPNYGGPKARFQHNVAAIQLLKQLEAEDRLATPAEQETLSSYVGWGGLSEAFDDQNPQWKEEYKILKDVLTEEEYASARESTLTAFYTPPAVTEAIFTGLRQLGFQGGNVLDPCCGTGNFFGMLPENMASSKLYGVELDSISGRIARQMYQTANVVIEGYEKTALPDSMFDVAIGNVPFGNFQLRDRRYDKEHFLIHDYFFAKTLDKVRPGGVIAFVTSKGTMDKENDAVRRYIAQRADLLGAIRLPDNTFKANAGTDAVADILFLQKRERPRVEEPYWVGLDRAFQGFDDNRESIWGPSINAYFIEHPEMVLGDLVEVSGPHGPVLTCKAREGEDLRTELQRAVKNIEGSIGTPAINLDALDEPAEQKNCIPADPNVRNFSYTVVDGDVYFREDSVMFRSELNKTAEKRVKGMVNLRNITRELINAQLDDAPDEHIAALQAQLNKAYDEFTKKHGLINSTANSRAFSDDSSYYLLCSLENLDDEGNFIGKADMFYKRTIGQNKAPEHVDTAKEALAVSMGELARVDLSYMSRLSDISEEKLTEDLKGLIFPVPGENGHYEISSIYLSGNVREKLREAQEAAKEDPRFLDNVEHLEKAMPEPLEASDISVRLGSTWIPPEDYKAFLVEFLKLPDYCERYMDVVYEPYSDSWSISAKNMAPYTTLINSTYGTSRINAVDIIERTLNLRDVQIYDTKTGPDGESHRVLNGEETLAAQEKQQQIKDAFCEWIWKDHDRRERLCNLYNEKFNSIVPPSFSEDLVQFHGLNPLIELAPHQKESVARILYNGNTLLAHTVGAGKTWTMTASAMEGKYLGLCHKSLIVVPNHLIGQWAAAIYEAYPQANVLASTEKDFEPANRKKFCSRIATGDYDIVVIGHSHFEKIPLSAQRQEAYIKKEMDDIIDSISELKAANGERFTIKKLEAARKSLQTKLDKLHNSKKRDDVVTFEELGVDRLYVDESHNYKNLFINSKMTNVAGISQTDSQKASDMFVKSRYMDEITGGMGIIHGTGSPLSNTMAELYTTQRYLQYDLLQKMGLGSFDAWASTFGETVVALELAPEGNGYRQRTRFSKFFNLPELMNLYKQVADIRTKDMLNLPVPAVEYQVEVLKPSEEQKAIVRSFGERAEKIRKGGVNSRDDNMLCITNEGRKVALDQRLIDPTLPDNPHSKTAACADSIYDFYVKGDNEKLTQLVFCDISTPKNGEFNVYDDLKQKLIAKGIPADEIRFIHEANTVPQKEALFAKVRSGAVRVLMGSTSKMGTGTNVQDRLIAGHDLDAPWRPSDLEQRAGRVIRRGNHNDKVYMRRYVTEGTFDAYMYQLLEIKQRFIDQIFSSKNPARTIDDVDGAALNYAEIKALSSGDERIKEKVTLEMEISKLEILKNRHQSEMFRHEHNLKVLPQEIQGLEERVSAMKEDEANVASKPSRTADGKFLPATVKGVTYEKQGETGLALVEAVKKLPREEWVTIGSLRGFQIQGLATFSNNFGHIDMHLAIAGKCRYSIDVPENASGQGIMMSLNNILDSTIAQRLETGKKRLAACKLDLKSAQEAVGKPFPDDALLQEKKARLAQLDDALNLENQENREQQVSSGEVDVEVVKTNVAAQKRSLSEIIANAERTASANFSGTGHCNDLSYSRS